MTMTLTSPLLDIETPFLLAVLVVLLFAAVPSLGTAARLFLALPFMLATSLAIARFQRVPLAVLIAPGFRGAAIRWGFRATLMVAAVISKLLPR